ncbi:MAG: carbonic anhydrase [Desulfobacterales bacterium]|nr:carbonic anhydrase [Desulfobacteraceae bacterium]MBT7086055.1 carbonic anhydrase [Desulfobacterales bacterium]MBT7697318.1 carbonic anhydrase [Desulfobacterales bacterium]
MIEEFLAGNRRFVDEEFNKNVDFYSDLSNSQQPKILWIGCSDSRVSEDVITSSKPGSIFVHRNIANIVAFNDINIASIIEYAVTHLKIPDIIVCGHYNCGGVQAMLEGVEEHYIADWLLIASGAIAKAKQVADEMKLSRKEHLDLLSEENVKLQIKHLRGLSLIRNLHKKGSLPRIHGWIYSVESGEINVLVDGYNHEA